MTRTTIERMRSCINAAWATYLALASYVLLPLALASCGVARPSSDGTADETIATQEEPVVWDTGDKPIPKNFLSRYSIYSSNRCCLTGTPGGNGDSPNCTKACGTSITGLVTADGVAKAADYYTAIGESSMDTFEKWKGFYGFPQRQVGETLDAYRARAKVVVYYNITELGLGRELGCAANGNDVACYVTNYGATFNDLGNSLNAAISGEKVRNTVVISYRASRMSRYAVQFSAFGADGKRIDKAQLDNHGARPIPQICMSCHGGHWNPDAQERFSGKFGLAEDARFLPLMTGTVLFSGAAPYRLADQEAAILHVNNLAWSKRFETLSGRQQDYLHWAYDGTGSSLAFRGGSSAQDTTLIAPWGWESKHTFYKFNVLPFCDTCHMAADSQHTTRTSAQSWAANYLPPTGTLSRMIARGWERDVSGDYGFRNAMTTAGISSWAGVIGYGTQRGAYTSSWGPNDHSPMPHAETAFARFWGDTSQTLQTCFIGVNRPPADCFFYELGIWPTAPTVTPPNTIHPAIPAPAKASAESHCGQANVTAISSTSGTNSGRRVNATQCADGCKKNEVFCPGSEGVGTNEYPGARLECAPSDATFGSCVACGAIGQAPCTRVGAGCDTGFNPNCTIALPCHEGHAAGGTCNATNLAQGASASQSSTWGTGVASLAVDGSTNGNYSSGSVAHTLNAYGEWWKVDLGGTRRSKRVELFGRTDCCADRLKGASVEYSTDNINFFQFPGGEFDFTAVGTSNMTVLTSAKPVELRYLRVRMRTSDFLHLAEVRVWGWTPINFGGGVVCRSSCVNSSGAIKCGGNGCSSLAGGAANCCQGSINASGVHCNGNPAANAPCILP